ncbi:hypothetical protein R5R35_001635 [Gryllus longicercus]|uniref:Tudor domain-containing protein n=1 Tax=Gryllus longicercus TaxID=2509291 RepID=A0AAN9Z8M7_9ORTH
MMTGAPQHIEIFVTHVAEDGPLLKIWGQLDRSAATFVERLILQYTEQFERGIGVVYPPSLSVDQLCCAKYGEDGVYYRARIADLSAIQQGFVRVNFIDYGNSDMVEISNIRSLQFIASSPLCSVQNQATEFALAGVVPPMGVSWDQASVDFIREKLCYGEFRCAIVAQISGRRLITLYYHDTDFSEILIQKKLAIRITLHAQQAMFQNLQYQYSKASSYNYNVPPPTVPATYSSNANLLVKTAAITKQESGVISAPILSVGSKYIVYISYVEDGPNLFAIQLKATENILQNMTQTFSHVPLKPFSQSPIPGSACVSLLPQAKVLCRAVVTNLMEKECLVYCVDFGNTETVPFSQIYELPSQFLQTKSLAMRFCLAGIQNTNFDEKAKRLFQELVTGETLTLEVVEPEGPPLKQYGNIYLNGENILQVLKEKRREFEKTKAYPPLPAIQPGRVVNVTVSYVESVDNFYVQYEANAKSLQKIMSTMVDYCTISAAMVRPNELYIGMPVCALFSADQQWYRARILSVAGDQITVFYVDYGNTDTVSLVSLRQMDSNLCQAQAQAVACSLSGYEAMSTSIEDVSNKFEELTLERKLTMKIVNRLSSGKLIVELHNTSGGPIVNIAHLLSERVKNPYEETPIDEWHDPAASGEPAALQTKQTHQFGKDRRSARKFKDTKHKKYLPSRSPFPKFGKLEDGSGEGWKGETKKSSSWNESRDTSKKWGNRDDKNSNDRKWGRGDHSGEQKRWGKEEPDESSGWENREDRGGSEKWESGDRRNNDKNWERKSLNRDGGDWKDRENKRFSRDDDWKDKENHKREFNKGDWKERDSSRRGFNKESEDWKSRDNKRGFGKDGDDWKESDDKRGFSKDGDDWKDGDNKRGFGRDNDNWKDRDNKRGFGKDSDDRKERDNRKFSRDNEDRNWRKRDNQGQEDRKYWAHDDRGEPEKKWNRKDDGEDQRKWGHDKRNSNTGEFKKWNNGDRGNRRNTESWKDQGAAASENWGASNIASKTEEDWNDGGTSTFAAGVNNLDIGAKVYPDSVIIIGTKENVTLVSADDPTNFVLQADKRIDDLTKMMENISTVYESGGVVIPEDNQKVLTPCITRYSEDNAWYRAVIANAPNEGVTEVHFVDYGNHEAVPLSDIKEVVPEFLNIPLFGVSCSLFAVKVPVTEWSSDQVTEFLTLTDGKKLEAHFIKKEGPLFEVVLFDTEDPSSSINEKFGALKASIEEGMSKKTFKQALPLQKSAFKHSAETEIVYASSDDSFATFEFSSMETDTVSVTWFINPGQFFCQRNSMRAEFVSMVNDIQTSYKGRAPHKGELPVGCPIIAQFPADKVLYRAEIKEIIGLKYQVQYIDYGNMELLASSNIWPIEKRFMVLPKQAIECCVSGINPIESEWPKDCVEFDKLFGAENLECTFYDNKEGKHLVTLQVNGKDIAEELVACGLALRKVEEKVISEEKLALKLLKEQQIPAHVSFIESVSKFFVHLDPVVAKSIQDKVDKHMSENKDTALLLQADMVDHQMCLATPDGNQWYRGKIIDTSGTVGVCVTFVDFGDSDDIPVDKIRQIPESLMGFRHQATECFVAGSEVSEVGKDVEETFKVEVEAQDVILSIGDIVNERLSVHLFDIEGQGLEILKNVDTSSPLDVEPLCPMPILVHTLRMWVSHVEKLNEIWLQKESEAEMLSGLLELLFNFYEEGKGVELGDPQEDQLCAAKSSKDGSWYRARVKSVTDDQISVVYIDYGNSETLAKEDVKELCPSFYRVHALSVCASLAITTQDHETSLAEFENITAGTVFDVSFVKDSENKWLIHMENDDTNVIHHLVKSGMGSETESFFLSKQVSLPENEKIDVSISHFESSSEFWVQMDSNFLDILELQSTLQCISSSQAVLSSVEVGTLCVAQFSDEAWYRAKVVEMSETSAKVHFLDYGNDYETDPKFLRKLPIKLFRWPHFAVRCRLSNDSFLENEELSQTCSEILSDTEAVFQLQVVGGNDPVLVSLFVGEKELEKAVIERREAESIAATTTAATEPDVVKSETVFVSHVTSPAKFWIQKEAASSELQNLADLLIQSADFEPVSDVQVGSVYAALFEDDEQWYRAKIMELCDDSYNVLFVDYGNSSIVSDLRILPEELVSKPFVAKCCQLQLPEGVECWSSEADKKFVELVGDGTETFQMIVLSAGEPSEVQLTCNENDVNEMLGKLCVSCPKPPSEGDLFATIVHIKNPCEFWIHWQTEASKLELITDKLIDAENFDPLEEFTDGLLCVAQFPEDEQWYRVRIISCQEQRFEVLFIDYGNTALVTEVHSIPEDLGCIPPLAKCCSLLLPEGLEKWPEKAEGEFINIFGDGTNTYKVTIHQDSDPLVISLELNGSDVTYMLQKCCEETGSEKFNLPDVSHTSSSTEVEILSETEVIIDSESAEVIGSESADIDSEVISALQEEKTNMVKENPSLKLENEECDPEMSDEIAKEIVKEMVENSVMDQGEQQILVDYDEQKSEVSVLPNSETKEENLITNDKGNENLEAHDYDVNDFAETSITGEKKIETEKLSVPKEKDVSTESEILSTESETFVTPNTEQVSTKKNEATKHTMEHSEQIIKDFSVEMQMPSKVTFTEGSQGAVGSPLRKLSHAERIVPGSISRGLSPTELETSPDKTIRQFQEHLEGTLKKMTDCEGSVNDNFNSGEVSEVAPKNDRADETDQSNNQLKEHLEGSLRDLPDCEGSVGNCDSNSMEVKIAREDQLANTQRINGDKKGTEGADESTNRTGPSLSSSEQKCSSTIETNTNGERETDNKMLNDSSLLSDSPQKTDHDTSGSTTNESGNPALDSSETNSVSTVSSSPQKGTQSVELETEMSGDVSGSLYEDSDSSANCTLIDSNATEMSKHVSVDEEKMKYKLAQIHTSEEQYETSKTESESSSTNSVLKEISHISQSESGTSLVEGRKE